jgi:peptidoglycan/LPS O-acetylase OafA/YrhL
MAHTANPTTAAIGQAPRPSPPGQQRNRSVDSVRGVACVLLVAYHVVGSGDEGLRLGEESVVRQVNDFLGYFRMPLFTVISGFVYAMRPFDGGAGRFVRGKARRLLVPLLVVGTAFALVQVLVPGTNDELRGSEWLLIHVDPVGLYWYLEALFLIFLAMLVLDGLRLLDRPAALAAVFVAAAAASVVFTPTRLLGINGAVYLLPYFLFGLGLQRFRHHVDRPRTLALGAVAAAVGAAWCIAGIVVGAAPSTRSLPALLAGCGLALLLLLARWQSSWLAWIGAYSYTIYLFHAFATAGIRISLETVGAGVLVLHVVLGTLGGLAFPVVLDHVARRWRWSRVALLGRRRPQLQG